jgi:hypothetical protein
MTRCIFRKPQRRLKLSQGLAVITVILGAALVLELQAKSNPNPPTVEASPLLGGSVTIKGWMLNSWSNSLR